MTTEYMTQVLDIVKEFNRSVRPQEVIMAAMWRGIAPGTVSAYLPELTRRGYLTKISLGKKFVSYEISQKEEV